ncbi:MAG: endonuclease dU [Candidatus Helarchaeota archaeon]
MLGIDDGPFKPRSKETAKIIGVVYRGNDLLEGVIQDDISVDGSDATKKIITLVKQSKFYEALKVIMLYGITVAGFNVIDPKKLFEELKLPIITIIEKMPDLDSIREALSYLEDGEEKWKIIKNNSNFIEFSFHNYAHPIYFTVVGMSEDDTRQIIKFSIKTGRIPEPIRVAHIIASSFRREKLQ